MLDNKVAKIFVGAVMVVFVFILSSLFVFWAASPSPAPSFLLVDIKGKFKSKITDLKTFSSKQEFVDYLVNSPDIYKGGVNAGMRTLLEPGMAMADSAAVNERAVQVPERVSETNVQVAGIDEPDIVKTDGQRIYVSGEDRYFSLPRQGMGIMRAVPEWPEGTKEILALPLEKMAVSAEIGRLGELLLDHDKLMIFSRQNVYGFDVAELGSPKPLWDLELADNNQMVSARLYQGNLYMIVRTVADINHPCPFVPVVANGRELSVRCVDIYHPVEIVPVDSTYTIMKINPTTGEVNERLSFIGSSNSATVYMSANAIYVAYYYPGDFIGYFSDFINKNKDLFSINFISRVNKLKQYDISDQAKMIELQTLLRQFEGSLTHDEALKLENEMGNKMADYHQENKRRLEKTGIAKVSVKNLKIKSVGSVPGQLLNQFSLDEYDGNLRVATTIGGGGIWWFGNIGKSVSDVYVLDNRLNIKGHVLDLGAGERIYSVRFAGDKGYLVTFRQIDPFYVLDLSDPSSPQVKGELKIPGYSSYLHPISYDKILGVGKEGSRVKISLFDVSNARNPEEASKYTIKEYWSDVLNTHHAFLQDSRHKIFFIPGSKGGYIFSYHDNNLELVKVVSGIRARRALFIDDYLYIIGDDKIIVLNENNWERIGKLNL